MIMRNIFISRLIFATLHVHRTRPPSMSPASSLTLWMFRSLHHCWCANVDFHKKLTVQYTPFWFLHTSCLLWQAPLTRQQLWDPYTIFQNRQGSLLPGICFSQEKVQGQHWREEEALMTTYHFCLLFFNIILSLLMGIFSSTMKHFFLVWSRKWWCWPSPREWTSPAVLPPLS